MFGVRPEHLAIESLSCPFLVGHDTQVDGERDDHDADAFWKYARLAAVDEPIVGGPKHLNEHDDQEDENAERGHGLVLPVAVRMILIRREARY